MTSAAWRSLACRKCASSRRCVSVPEPAAHGSDGNARAQELRGVQVAQVVETDPGHADMATDATEAPGDKIRMEWRSTIHVRADT